MMNMMQEPGQAVNGSIRIHGETIGTQGPPDRVVGPRMQPHRDVPPLGERPRHAAVPRSCRPSRKGWNALRGAMAVPQVKLKCSPTPKDGVRSAHPTACWNAGIFAMSELLVTVPKEWASIIPVLTSSEYPKSSAFIIRYLAKARLPFIHEMNMLLLYVGLI